MQIKRHKKFVTIQEIYKNNVRRLQRVSAAIK